MPDTTSTVVHVVDAGYVFLISVASCTNCSSLPQWLSGLVACFQRHKDPQKLSKNTQEIHIHHGNFWYFRFPFKHGFFFGIHVSNWHVEPPIWEVTIKLDRTSLHQTQPSNPRLWLKPTGPTKESQKQCSLDPPFPPHKHTKRKALKTTTTTTTTTENQRKYQPHTTYRFPPFPTHPKPGRPGLVGLSGAVSSLSWSHRDTWTLQALHKTTQCNKLKTPTKRTSPGDRKISIQQQKKQSNDEKIHAIFWCYFISSGSCPVSLRHSKMDWVCQLLWVENLTSNGSDCAEQYADKWGQHFYFFLAFERDV